MKRFWIPSALLVLVAGFALYQTKKETSPAREPAFSLFKSQPLDEKEILEASSSPALKASKVRVLIDNDAAFDTKIEAIRSARTGETIRLTYYIYSQDQSSALFLKELLNAAQRGVQIKLMADFLTNYGHLDLFTYLEAESQGRIQVKLYGRPTPLIVRDTMFLTTPCPPTSGKVKSTTCSDAKWKNLQNTAPDFFARMMLSGLYSINLEMLSTAIIKGQMIDLNALTGGSGPTSEEKKQFLEFLKLAYKAKAKGDALAGIKVLIALQMYGEKLNPVLNEILGHVPISQRGNKSLSDWEHITDFTHHKVLIVGNRFVQLGGRNIENSYHMKRNALTDKYIFMDTDVAAEIYSGGDTIASSYDKLWNFDTMTIAVKDVRKSMPNDLSENFDIVRSAFTKCQPRVYKTTEDRSRLSQCLETEVPSHPQYQSLENRLKKIGSVLEGGVIAYNTQYLPKKSYNQTWKADAAYSDEFSSADLSNLLLSYIENVPYDKNKSGKELERIYGSTAGQEMKHGKYIHHLMYKGLENACAIADKENREKRVIIHSAYFIPPAVLLRGFSKMMNGTWDCKNVRVTFITNSPETTDLNHINIAARYQMAVFFKVYNERRKLFGSIGESRSAKFEYFEYLKEPHEKGLSLHAKVTVLGDDAIIGSANADVRSYYMDTNNGFFIRGAKEFVSNYVQYIDKILQDRSKTRELSAHFGDPKLTPEAIFVDDRKALEKILGKAEFTNNLSPVTKAKIFDGALSVVKFISETTRKILVKEEIHAIGNAPSDVERKRLREQAELEQKFDRLLQLL